METEHTHTLWSTLDRLCYLPGTKQGNLITPKQVETQWHTFFPHSSLHVRLLLLSVLYFLRFVYSPSTGFYWLFSHTNAKQKQVSKEFFLRLFTINTAVKKKHQYATNMYINIFHGKRNTKSLNNTEITIYWCVVLWNWGQIAVSHALSRLNAVSPDDTVCKHSNTWV